jgi:hypothetical protein
MPRIWWIVGPNGLPIQGGRVIANTYTEADQILFYRLCHSQCPVGSSLEEADFLEEVEAHNIISVEKIR